MMRLLIVDDEVSVRRSLAAFLEDYDFVVETAESSEVGLQKVGETPFDVAIVDLRLPGMSGEEFICHAAEIAPGLRFLIHTGSREYTLSDSLVRLGVKQEHVIYKPLKELCTLIDGITLLVNEKVDSNE
ncbi:MAG: response regulator [Candidatus Zixiibacteriota bacterium]